MVLFSQIALLLSLGGVVWQDFRDRWISIGFFLAIGFIALATFTSGLSDVSLLDISANFLFAITCFLSLALFSKMRYGRFFGFIDTSFGKGDMAFIVVLALLLPFGVFILFFVCSTFIVLVASLLYQLYRRDKPMQIPLAGGQALLLMIYFVLGWWMNVDLLDIKYFI